MVNRILKLINQELKGVHQAAFLLGGAMLFSKILALLRDRLLASRFGAGEMMDIYFASFRIPDFLYTLTLLVAASTAVMPVLLKKISENEEDAKRFMGGMLVLFFAAALIMVFVAFFTIPYLTGIIAPGFSDEQAEEIVLLSRILLLSPLLLGFSNLVLSIIQSFRRFFVYALSPIFYNAGIILGILFLYPLWGIAGLGWGVALGSMLHLLVQIPSVLKLGFKPRLNFSGLGDGLLEVVKLSFPRTIGLSINQIVLMSITAIASMLGAGSIAVFNFASNLYAVPLSVVGVSYSIAAFPTLARLFAENSRDEFFSNVFSSLRHIFFWSMPAVILFMVLRAQIVRVVLGAGAFGWADTRLTAAALFLFSFSILTQGVVMLYTRAFYAGGRTAFPLAVNFASSAVMIAGAFFLARAFESYRPFRETFTSFMKVSGVEGSAMLVLPLAFSIGSIINAFLLAFGFGIVFKARSSEGFWKSIFEITFAGALAGMFAYGGLNVFDDVFNLQTFAGVFSQGLCSGVLGMLAGAIALYISKNREFFEIANALHQKFWRAKIISQEPEKLP